MKNWLRKFPKNSKGTEKPAALDNLETVVLPPEVSTTDQIFPTDAGVQGNLVLEYEQKFANLPEHLQLTKLCSNAGLAKTVEKGQYLTTLDDTELDRLKGSCREYTLPRSDQSPQVKGWIWKHKDRSSSGCDCPVIIKDVVELKS